MRRQWVSSYRSNSFRACSIIKLGFEGKKKGKKKKENLRTGGRTH